MPIFRILCLILFAHPAFAAKITLDRGPTGNALVTFIELNPNFEDRMARDMAAEVQRGEDLDYFRRGNESFRDNGVQPDGAGTAGSELARYAYTTFKRGRVFRLEGLIQAGDTARLETLTASYFAEVCPQGETCPYSAVLSLNSPGGSFAEAIRLARFIRTRSLVTVVDKGDRCESACALAFLSAYDVFEGHRAPRRFAHLEARIGIHQPAVALDPSDPRGQGATPADLFRLANLAVGEVTSLFLRTGVSIGALDRMYATPAENMLVLTPAQLMAEQVRVFDDAVTEFRGGRADLIAFCTQSLAARTYATSGELLSNFQMREDIFLTSDVGQSFLCTGVKDEEGFWKIMDCFGSETCPLWTFLDPGDDEPGPDLGEEFIGLEFWLMERGYLGFRQFAHRGHLLDLIRKHHAVDAAAPYGPYAYKRVPIPASALPMPPELCGKLDEAHPELVRIVQTKLPTYGFDAGSVDGSLGPKTRQAVQDANAQIAPDAPPNNRITPALLKAMRIPQATVDRFTLCHPAYKD